MSSQACLQVLFHTDFLVFSSSCRYPALRLTNLLAFSTQCLFALTCKRVGIYFFIFFFFRVWIKDLRHHLFTESDPQQSVMKLLKWNSYSKQSAESSLYSWIACETLPLCSAELHTGFFPPLTFTRCGTTEQPSQLCNYISSHLAQTVLGRGGG